ncbi:hypothetical protein QBC37DRAFT_404293 [Rhypophila decipiens]|uniref:DUF7730 domain-containing protein n=1 Tax=Rhypophila decipiens TaxID=261697 RepID=A0AAN6XYU5_9PEZI|nr:hypothetical protein QBC37DRAFT_404293 [Rhypophila decipiens]
MEEPKPLHVNDPAPGQAAQVAIPTSKFVDDLIKHDGDWTLHLSKQRDSIFFQLPVEIRLLIYRELLTLAFHISLPEKLTLMSMGFAYYFRKVFFHALVARPHFRRRQPSCLKLHPEILRTCLAIFAEAVPILYREKHITIVARSGPTKEAPKFSVNGIESDENLRHLQPILRYAHHLRIFIVDIVFHGTWENDFRHKVDCIFLFLQKIPQVDCLLVRLDDCGPSLDPSKSIGYLVSQRRMARNSVESVLGRLTRLHNIRKVWFMESMSILRVKELARLG